MLVDDGLGVKGFLRGRPDNCEKLRRWAIVRTQLGFSCPDQAMGGLDDLKKASSDLEIA